MKAETPTHIIASGKAESPQSIILSDYNRITFLADRITLSSSKSESTEQIDLLYELYNHLEFGLGETTSIMDLTSTSQFYYDAQSHNLILSGVENFTDYKIGVFSLNGTLLNSGKMNPNGTYDISNMTPGAYIAIVTNGKDSNHSIKFIIK